MGSCFNSIVVKAPIEKVWNTVKDFHSMSWAADVIESIEAVGDKPGSEPGARRKLNGEFLETLVDVDGGRHRFSYTIDDGPGPLAAEALKHYQATVQLSPVTATGDTYVLWTSEFASADDSAVSEFANPIYRALLDGLAKHLS